MTLQKESKFACLTYHAFAEAGDQYVITERAFRDQLELMTAEGYVVEGFQELERRLQSGEELPGRYAILTMDDGRASTMRAAELLEEYDCRATFFLSRDKCLGRAGYILAPEIRDLRDAGFSLGTHGTTHRKLSFLPWESCAAELEESKQWLEDVLGGEVSYMAAPGGFINSRVSELAQERGYVLIGTCNEWMNSRRTLRLPCRVNRVTIRRHFSLRDLRRILQGSLDFYLWRQVRSVALATPKHLFR